MTTIIVVTISLAAVISFALIMKRFRATGIKVSKKIITPPPSKKPEEEFKEILNVLLKLNLMIRKDIDLPKEIISRLEKTIDNLKTILPAMIERYPGEALTYEIKRIGLSHLYKTVKEFCDLSMESRQNQMDNFTAIIQNLQEVTARAMDIIENNETAEFKTMAHFLAGKFS
ncbi:MAG: hypothetical protein GY710_19275 [Desulfobacteraceae bacterium]|nr:hypothetical protein [Desulfobacteraceae bacterium]